MNATTHDYNVTLRVNLIEKINDMPAGLPSKEEKARVNEIIAGRHNDSMTNIKPRIVFHYTDPDTNLKELSIEVTGYVKVTVTASCEAAASLPAIKAACDLDYGKDPYVIDITPVDYELAKA